MNNLLHLTSLIQIVLATALFFTFFMFIKSKNKKHKLASFGLITIATAFVIKAIFNYFMLYSSIYWVIAETLDVIGIIIIVYSIIKK